MAIITQDQWQSIIDKTEPQRPSKGKVVKVVAGKYKGQVGQVTWHGVNKFARPFDYMTSPQIWLCEARGREGYRVRIAPRDGGAPFFVDAERVEVLTAEQLQAEQGKTIDEA